LLFVEGVRHQEALPEVADLFWRKISYQRVGCITTHVGLFGFLKVQGWELEAKDGWEIGHIINYVTRSQAAVKGRDPAFKHYKVGNWLRGKDLGLPVVCATHWCSTSFGYRSSEAWELSSAFD
jgi:hypothetical protein